MSDSNPENKLVISAALAGAVTTKANNPNTPYTAEEFGDEAKACYDAGAAIVHIHARHPEKGNPTHELDILKAILENIKSKAPDVIINLSTAISVVANPKQRIEPVKTFQPPLASLNTNSMNFAVGDYHTGKVAMGADNIFANTFKNISKFAKEMKKVGTKPEMEIYDVGGLYNMLFLNRNGEFMKKPLHFQFVWGVLGGIPFNPRNFSTILDLCPSDSTWSVCGVSKQQFQAALFAAAWGGHIRVGLEDNTRVINGELAKGSWEQVVWAKKVADIAGREVAQGDEAREIFHLKKEHVLL